MLIVPPFCPAKIVSVPYCRSIVSKCCHMGALTVLRRRGPEAWYQEGGRVGLSLSWPEGSTAGPKFLILAGPQLTRRKSAQ